VTQPSLLEQLRVDLGQDGPISVERYMGLALTDPVFGYYMTRDPFGAAGDFVTAPEISQMFGELIGLWAAGVWNSMGQPKRLLLIELGPGRGTLMQDALRAARIVPEFRAALEVHFVETSPILREAQRAAIAQSGLEAAWHDRIETVPEGPAIIIANEFFDALPVRHYVKTPDGWCERLIGLAADGSLSFGMAREPEPYIKADAETGAVLEIGAIAYQVMLAVAARIRQQGGAALVVDYGHTETMIGETLQAVHNHQFVDPLDDPGTADLTAHVDFAALSRAARAVGADVHGTVTQRDFLIALGINERAKALRQRADAAHAAEIDAALKRLIGDDSQDMGGLFKVLAITQPGMPRPPGFGTDQSS
jgi:NADH dehydrogenase [ubiquinone] 1 alpha subcomplex assembly factor 7